MTEAIWPSMLHEDPRYFRKVHGSFCKSRLAYAATRVLVTRTDAGNWRFNTSGVHGERYRGCPWQLVLPGRARPLSHLAADGDSDRYRRDLGSVKEFWPDIKHKWLHRPDNPNTD